MIKEYDPDVFRIENAEKARKNGFKIDPIRYFKEAWGIFKQYPIHFIVFSGVYIALIYISSQSTLAYLLNPEVEVERSWASFFAQLVQPALAGGFYIFVHAVHRKEEIEFPIFFKGFDYFLPLLIVSLLSNLIVIAGAFLLILPGIYASVCLTFIIPIVVLLNANYFKAIEYSWKIVHQQWFQLFTFLIMSFVVMMAGFFFFGVGGLVTLPIGMCSIYIAFYDILAQASQQNTSADWMM